MKNYIEFVADNLLENLDSNTPLLTIAGIAPEGGNCSAMLIVI